MVELALPRALHALGQRAIAQAAARRAGTVESEHLLLAILADSSSTVTAALEKSGLSYDTLGRALDVERTRSLSVAGIVPPESTLLRATPRTTTPAWGASIRDVLRGADKLAAQEARSGALERELARTILEAKLGTVPRAIALASLSREALRATLASE
jgi:ATP-dependent Clp protease ATP-binding subunit ClpA